MKVKRWQKRILWKRRFFRVLRLTLLSVALLFSGYGIYKFFIHSPYFKIEEIKIEGNHEINRKDILALLNMKKGDNIFKVELRQAKRRLRSLNQIKDMNIHRDFPDRIVLKITERVPIAQFDREDNVHSNKVELIDKEGVTFLGKARDIPRILGAKDSHKRKEVVDFLSKLMAVDFQFYKKISYIDGNNPRKIRLKTDQALLIWGPVGKETETQLEKKLTYLNLVLQDLLRNSKTFNYLDLRFLREGKGEIIVG
ncbi:MAG: cell division protein FtsQ/DivIB [bacterium]